jgi:hypothetical protein
MKPMADSKSIQIIKQSNVPSGEMETYQPFNMALVVGEKDYKNRITQKIVGDDNSITASGVTMIGVMPVPWNETYTVGDKISADDIFEEGSEKEGFATIRKLINMKDKEDIDGMLNYFQQVNKSHNYEVKYAETVELAAEDAEVFDEQYETFMAELGMSYYPKSKMYESNV